MMKRKIVMLVAAVMVLSASPAFALFTNGGFETGDWTGWTLDWGTRSYNSTTITWGQADHGRQLVMDNTATMTYQTTDINPYNGTYMARINDVAGNYHATKISQSGAISQQDIDDGATIYVNWGAALIEPSNTHPVAAQPYFGITLTVGGDVTTFQADAATKQGGGWTDIASGSEDLWYKQDTWSADISSYALGTNVTLEMFVVDCGWGGHGGYAFLDGIGTTEQPVVPVPGAFLLGGLGLAFSSWRLRRRKELLN